MRLSGNVGCRRNRFHHGCGVGTVDYLLFLGGTGIYFLFVFNMIITQFNYFSTSAKSASFSVSYTDLHIVS